MTRGASLLVAFSIGTIVALGAPAAKGQCPRPTSSDTTPMASVFVAELLHRRLYTEFIYIGSPPAERPMVELTLRVLYGWNERPRILPDDNASDTLRIRIQPEQDLGLPAGARVVAFMKRVYLTEIILSPPDTPTARTRVGSGMLVLAANGLCAPDSARAELNRLGTPQWRRAGPR